MGGEGSSIIVCCRAGTALSCLSTSPIAASRDGAAGTSLRRSSTLACIPWYGEGSDRSAFTKQEITSLGALDCTAAIEKRVMHCWNLSELFRRTS